MNIVGGGQSGRASRSTRGMHGWFLGLLCLTVPTSVAAEPTCVAAGFAVAVDVGHSTKSPGAVSARGVPELRFNLELARAVADALVAVGFRGSFLINGDGRIRSLGQRPAEAGRRRADLFLSIHHDSVQPRYLSTWTSDGLVRRYSDRFRGYSLFVSGKNARFDDSRRFAELLGRALAARGLAPTLHHAEPIVGEGRPLLDAELGIYRYDGLAVLKSAAMPAVLLEAGVILHRDEELLLAQSAYRQRIAAAAVSAVRGFCDVSASR